MDRELVKLAYRLGYQFAMEKQAAPGGGVLGRLLNTILVKPSKAALKAVFDPTFGLSTAGQNAEIRRRTGKWVRDEARKLVIPAAGGKPAIPIESPGPETIHLFHRPAAILHHLFKSGPHADFNRAAAGGGAVGIGSLLGLQALMKDSDNPKPKKRRNKKSSWW